MYIIVTQFIFLHSHTSSLENLTGDLQNSKALSNYHNTSAWPKKTRAEYLNFSAIINAKSSIKTIEMESLYSDKFGLDFSKNSPEMHDETACKYVGYSDK